MIEEKFYRYILHYKCRLCGERLNVKTPNGYKYLPESVLFGETISKLTTHLCASTVVGVADLIGATNIEGRGNNDDRY